MTYVLNYTTYSIFSIIRWTITTDIAKMAKYNKKKLLHYQNQFLSKPCQTKTCFKLLFCFYASKRAVPELLYYSDCRTGDTSSPEDAMSTNSTSYVCAFESKKKYTEPKLKNTLRNYSNIQRKLFKVTQDDTKAKAKAKSNFQPHDSASYALRQIVSSAIWKNCAAKSYGKNISTKILSILLNLLQNRKKNSAEYLCL